MSNHASIFSFRPKIGDIWSIKLPDMKRIYKEIGEIRRKNGGKLNGKKAFKYVIYWKRPRTGRKTSISLRALLTYGRRERT